MTHASCPLGSEVRSPARAISSVPSSIRIASSPLTWYWKWGASQLSVPAIGFTSFDQRQPGSSTRRPISAPPISRISARPFGNSRVSDGEEKLLCSVSCLTNISTSCKGWQGWRESDLLVGKLSRSTRATSERILDTAERLVQMRGFNGFSYADVAGELDITTASLHYHYRGKAELGKA